MKKTDLFILTCAFAVSSLCACSKDNMAVHEPTDSLGQIETIPIENALSTLDRCISCLYDAVTRATSKSYDISKICTVGGSDIFGPMTKSGSETDIPDTLLYVVNFENDNGYAILSANTILSESVFCITETGQMALDTTGISIAARPDLGNGIEKVVNEREDRELSDEEAEADTLYISGISPDEAERTVQELVLSRVIDDIYNYETTHVKPVEKEVNRPTTGPATDKYGPFLKTKWGQKKPFNGIFNRNTNDNNKIPMGCVAIATGQIMVSNKHSSSMTFNGKPCNWDDLESVCNYASPGI